MVDRRRTFEKRQARRQGTATEDASNVTSTTSKAEQTGPGGPTAVALSDVIIDRMKQVETAVADCRRLSEKLKSPALENDPAMRRATNQGLANAFDKLAIVLLNLQNAMGTSL